MPSPNVLANAKRGSITDLEQLWKGMSPDDYSIEAFKVILTHLQTPIDHGTISKQEQKVAFTILERGLKTAIRSCPPSLSANLSQQLALACEGIVFWMWKFVGEGCDENYKNWKFEGPNGQDGPRTLALYNCADIIVHLLQFDTVGETLGRSRLLHQMLLDWWTATSNGEIIVDPWLSLEGGLKDGVPDLQVLIFAYLSGRYAKEMAEAIMSPPPRPGGRTPATFTTGTIQRMRSLTRINTQQHQGHWPADSVTYEIANLNGIVLGLANLVKVSSDLHYMLLQENVPKGFFEDFTKLSVRLSTPSGEGASVANYANLVRALEQVTSWSSDAPVPHALPTMKHLLKNGLLNIVATYINMRTSEWNSEEAEITDRAVKAVLLYCYEVGLHPRLTRAVRRACRDFMKKLTCPLPTPEIEATVKHYVVGFEDHSYHPPVSSRVKICDSLDHWPSTQNIVGLSDSKSRTCSGCHAAVYCSPKCQEEDWSKRHRDECNSLFSEYRERKALSSWYSHNVRTFHLSCIRHAYATTNFLWNVVKGRQNCIIDSRIVVSASLACAESPYRFNTLEEYVEVTTALLPQHKLGRFNEIVERFRVAKAHPQKAQNGVSFLSLGLINGEFRFGDIELNYVVLLRRRAETTLFGEQLNFEVEGYVTYTCEVWDRVDTCPSPMLLYLKALGVEGGFEFGDTTRVYET